MSSSSDEDENLKLILEAADTSFLTDSLFQGKKDEDTLPPLVAGLAQSQRNLQDGDYTCNDFVPSRAVQQIMSKKLSVLVQEQIEFTANLAAADSLIKKKKRKSRVRLLKDFECYAKPYEEFEFEEVGPLKKPTFKRRAVDNEVELDTESKLKAVVVDGNSILSGHETLNWAKETKGKVFCYKLGGGANKVQHLIEAENEFTKLRRKNKWNESKIKTKFGNKYRERIQLC